MLSWPSYLEWRRDNAWKPLASAPRGSTVDLFAYRQEDRRECPTGQRFHGCVLTADGWYGLPEGWRPRFWAEPMPTRRVRALTVA